MPIPFLLAGLGLAAGAIGVGGHMSAKETNEQAQSLAQSAQDLYNDSKESLEKAQQETEKALLTLGYSKKGVLEGSMKQFLHAYDKIKNIQLKESTGLNELSKFTIDQQDIIEIRKMTDIYESSLAAGAAGAAAGTIIALAASGSLPIVTGAMSSAAAALSMGSVGTAAGLATSALSFGAAMTPLTAIAAPVLLFTGISSSIKADENLEKAHAMYAEAELASENMKISELKCDAISGRSYMFNDLLEQLNTLFSECTDQLTAMVDSKTGILKNRKIDARTLTKNEEELIYVTRSIAGAIKAVIDTPILSDDGNISQESENLYESTAESIPAYTERVKQINTYDYDFKKPEVKQIPASTGGGKAKPEKKYGLPTMIRNVFAVLFAAFAALIGWAVKESAIAGWTTFSITMLLMMNTKVGGFFGFIRKMLQYSLILEGAVIIYYYAPAIVSMKYSVIGLIIAVVAGFVLFGMTGVTKKRWNLYKLIQRIFSIVVFGAISLLLFKLLYGAIKMPFKPAIIISEVIFALGAIFGNRFAREFDNPRS